MASLAHPQPTSEPHSWRRPQGSEDVGFQAPEEEPSLACAHSSRPASLSSHSVADLPLLLWVLRGADGEPAYISGFSSTKSKFLTSLLVARLVAHMSFSLWLCGDRFWWECVSRERGQQGRQGSENVQDRAEMTARVKSTTHPRSTPPCNDTLHFIRVTCSLQSCLGTLTHSREPRDPTPAKAGDWVAVADLLPCHIQLS